MDEYYEYGKTLTELARLCDENGMEHFEHAVPAEEGVLAFKDEDGSWHDCWEAGSSHLVNVTFALTPEQAVAVMVGLTYGQLSEIEDAVEDAMKHAYNLALTYRDPHNTYWDSGNYVNRILDAIDVTVGEHTCHFKTINQFIDNRRSRGDICECNRCGYQCARGFIEDERFKCCPGCGARIEVDA